MYIVQCIFKNYIDVHMKMDMCMCAARGRKHGLHFINETCIPVARASNFSGYATGVMEIHSEPRSD